MSKIDNFPVNPSDEHKHASPEAIAKIKLTANNVLVRIEAAPQVSKGGIFLPPAARNSMQQEVKRCTVLATGPGCYTGEICQGCKGEGQLEADDWYQIKAEMCSVCSGKGHIIRKPYVQPGDVVYFNYLSDHGEIKIEEETGLRIVRDVVFQAVEEDKRIRPLQDRILVRRSKELATSKGGIIIPDNAKEKQVEGEVLAVGDGRIRKTSDNDRFRPEVHKSEGMIPVCVKPGDVIVFGKYDGNEIEVGGEKLVLMKEDCALAVLEKSE